MPRDGHTWIVALLATAGFGVLASPAAAAEYEQPCGGTSWWAGTTAICDGTIVYRDYVNDDYGADTGKIAAYDSSVTTLGSLAAPAGDVNYPVGAESTADLVRLELTPKDGKLHVRAELGALFEAGQTVLGIAVDTDDNAVTGGGAWKELAASSTGWDELHLFKTGDPAANTIEGDIPLPARQTFRLQAVTARADGTVMNVAFRGPDEEAAFQSVYPSTGGGPLTGQGSWFEDRQAQALGAGDISGFGYSVNRADLVGRRTILPKAGEGLHERVYTSEYTLPPGEGMTFDGDPGPGTGGTVDPGFAQLFNFRGKYQPYSVYIPKGVSKSPGLQLVYHGSGAVINSIINQPHAQERLGDAADRVLAVPLARGPDGYGSSISERDVLDVQDDIEAVLPIDLTRVIASGYSQGGYITLRQSEMYPQRYAGLISWVGFAGEALSGLPDAGVSVSAGALGDTLDYVRNLRNVPASLIYGAQDELIPLNLALAIRDRFEAEAGPYTFYLHSPAEHFTFALLDDWRKEAADVKDLRLVANPPRITHRFDSRLEDPKYGISHARAYWLSEIRAAKEGFADIDALNQTCGGTVPRTQMADGAGADPVPWESRARKVTGAAQVDERAALTLATTNVASLRVASGATCTNGKAFSYKVTTDGPLTLAFSDGRELRLPAAGTFTGRLEAPTITPVRSCASRRRFRVHVRNLRGIRLRKLTLTVNGRRTAVRRGARVRTVVVDLRRLPKATAVVRVRVDGTIKGRRIVRRDTRTYRTCIKRP
jgi:pimeloyl-ACP methyl ester carboxylesterase